jgi:hypothetical protein
MQKPNAMRVAPQWLLLLVGLALGCATAPPTPSGLTPEQQRIHRLLVDLALPQFAERLETISLRVAGRPRDHRLPEDQRLVPLIETQLAPDAVVSDVVRRVSEAFDEASVAEIERFAASETGQKVRDATRVPYSWLSRLGYRMFGSVAGGPPERVALVEKLEQLTLSSQTSGELYLRIYESIVRWYHAKGFVNSQESDAVGGIDGLIARERERVAAVSAQHSVPFYLYVFSDLSTPELAEYVAQSGSPAGQWYAKAVRDALSASIQERSAAISR